VITATAEDQRILSIQSLCALLGVSRSWYYERLSQPEATPIKDLALRDAIEEIVLAFPGYGYRRVAHALARDGWSVNHKRHPERTRRVMREEFLLCQLKRRFVATTDSQLGCRRYPNRIKDLIIAWTRSGWLSGHWHGSAGTGDSARTMSAGRRTVRRWSILHPSTSCCVVSHQIATNAFRMPLPHELF